MGDVGIWVNWWYVWLLCMLFVVNGVGSVGVVVDCGGNFFF